MFSSINKEDSSKQIVMYVHFRDFENIPTWRIYFVRNFPYFYFF